MSLVDSLVMQPGSAQISACGRFRYTLTREWEPFTAYGGGAAVWLMLNPSTADAEKDDPTVRRCIHFSASWGYNKLVIVNLFPFRSSSPKECLAWVARGERAVDEELISEMRRNRERIREQVKESAMHVVAFGRNLLDAGWAGMMLEAFIEHARNGVHCLGTSGNGMPKHPMARGKHRVPDDFSPVQWRWPA